MEDNSRDPVPDPSAGSRPAGSGSIGSGPTDSKSTITSRLKAVDALRALALLGILSVNVWFFAYPEYLDGGTRASAIDSSSDQLVRFVSTLLFEGKSYVVFSFLFGLSFVLAWASAYRSGVSETGRTLRRAAALGVLGLLHGILLFVGDILLAYAVLGLALLGMRRISTRWAVTIAAVLFAVIPAVLIGSGLLAMTLEGTAAWDDALLPSSDPEAARDAYTGSLVSYLSFQLSAYAIMLPNILLGQGTMVLGAFLIGLVVGRAQLVERMIRKEVPTWRLIAVMLPTLMVGLLLSATASWILWGPPGSTAGAAATSEGKVGIESMASGVIFLAGPLQATGYVLLAILIFRAPVFSWLVSLLAPAGRMSLTNYLSQSLVLMLIFAAPGLGMAGQLSATAVGGVVVLLWCSQLLLSALWFRRFTRGPLEKPVRAVTYGRRKN